MPWEPILDGALADAARRAVREIAAGIAADPGDAVASERALFWAYATNQLEELSGSYDAALDELGRQLAKGAPSPALYQGLAGIGFTLAHVVDDVDDVLAKIDGALLQLLAGDSWDGHFDLVSGLVGYGVYFLERGPAGVPGLERVVGHLAARATTTADGHAWHTPSRFLDPSELAASPDGYFDCGVAHGTPGVIALLARAAPAVPAARPLAESALRWLAAQKRPEGFPTFVGADRTRDAWCYGGPGVAAATWNAVARLGAPLDLAREAALDVAMRGPAKCSGVRDAMLCHGATGLAHLCNRFYQASGRPAFRDAARAWFEHALARRGDGGIGGFAAWRDGWTPVARLLDGSIGVALALLAATTTTEPNWDRLMLCDLPVRT